MAAAMVLTQRAACAAAKGFSRTQLGEAFAFHVAHREVMLPRVLACVIGTRDS